MIGPKMGDSAGVHVSSIDHRQAKINSWLSKVYLFQLEVRVVFGK
ncbi:hypothetical protein RADP37_05540 [Roseomonas mucosa]|uniref:Uncharacterized protein n=1 Tax=Roseomonas mucosa TaxID=207340 RepID=A0A4Y1MTQ1_9PROT|nr:hypothetical protein RADP37_05540 [Roseomonas mucosa]